MCSFKYQESIAVFLDPYARLHFFFLIWCRKYCIQHPPQVCCSLRPMPYCCAAFEDFFLLENNCICIFKWILLWEWSWASVIDEVPVFWYCFKVKYNSHIDIKKKITNTSADGPVVDSSCSSGSMTVTDEGSQLELKNVTDSRRSRAAWAPGPHQLWDSFMWDIEVLIRHHWGLQMAVRWETVECSYWRPVVPPISSSKVDNTW